MCGIAGLIHRDGATSVGKEMTAMLARELLVRFQTSHNHPLNMLNKAYRKF